MEMVLMVSTDDDGSQAEEEDEKTETDQQVCISFIFVMQNFCFFNKF